MFDICTEVVSKPCPKVFADAVALLARREYGAQEMLVKLAQKGHGETDIRRVLAECQRLDLQSDSRFIQSIYRARVRQGYGPLWIVRALQDKHIDREVIRDFLAEEVTDWVACARRVVAKKYKSQIPGSSREQQQQKQFLLYRGFTSDTISTLFAQISEGCHDE